MVSSELYAGGWPLLEWIGNEYPAHAVARGRASDKVWLGSSPITLAASERHRTAARWRSVSRRCVPPSYSEGSGAFPSAQIWRLPYASEIRTAGMVPRCPSPHVRALPAIPGRTDWTRCLPSFELTGSDRQAASHTAQSFSVTLSIHASPSLIESVV